MAVPFQSSRLSASRLNRPTSPTPIRRSTTSLIPVAPSRLRAVGPRRVVGSAVAPTPVRRLNIVKPQRVSTSRIGPVEKKKEDLGFFESIAAIPKGAGRIVAETIRGLPTFVGKAAQTAAGLGEGAFDFFADLGSTIAGSDKELYTSRFETDLAKGRALGLKGTDLIEYASQRQYPLGGAIVSSYGRTGSRALDNLTFGLAGTGEPGMDYYNAFRRGELADMLFEDVGNVLLAGRMGGAGNVGVRAGSRLTQSGRPGLGRAVARTSRLIEEPIGSTVRGAAGLASRIPQLRPGMRAGLTAIAGSERPLRTAVTQSGSAYRRFAESMVNKRVAELDTLRTQLGRAEQSGNQAEIERISQLMKEKDANLQSWVRSTEAGRTAKREVRLGQRETEAVATTIPQTILRYEQLGSVPDSPEQLTARATQLRELAQTPQNVGRADQLNAQADFLDRQARVKQTADPEKLNNKENRKINFSAATIVMSKIIDQIMADRRAGKSIDEIMQTLPPRELLPEVEAAGYGYTRAAVQRAIDFVEGRLDDVDALDMDVASNLLSMTGDFMRRIAEQPGVFVSGVISPAQFADTPVPEFLVAELGRVKFANAVYAVLDDLIPTIIETEFPETLDQFDSVLKNPEGSFKKFAQSSPNTVEYQVARLAAEIAADNLSNPATSVLSGNPSTAVKVAEFFRKPSIYAARMRPMLAYRQTAGQQARAEDVNNALLGLKQLIDEFPEVVSVKRRARLTSLLDEFAKPRRQFDRDFYNQVQTFIGQVLRDINKSKSRTAGKIVSTETRVDYAANRLAEVEAQARAVAGMVEQALFRPEELAAEGMAETGGLRSEAEALRSEAAQLQGLPDTVNTIRTEMNSNTDKLAEVRRRAEESNTEARDLEGRLAIEERLLREGTMPEDELPLFLAELDEAVRRREQGIDAEPTPAEQRAWKAQRVAERQAEVDLAEQNLGSFFRGGRPYKIAREDFWVEDVWVNLKKAIPNDRHLRAFFQNLTETKYLDQTKSRIPIRAEMRVVDPNVGKLTGRYTPLDEVASDNPRGPISTEEWSTRLAEAWSAYMETVDRLNEAKRKPLKSDKQETVLQAMLNERANDVQNQAWENPLTGETVYGIRSLEQLQAIEKLLTNTESLADQVRKVENIRRDLEVARRRSQEATRQARDLNERINELSRQAVEAEAQSPRLQAARLVSQADTLTKQADQLEAENVRLRPTIARERLTLTRPSGRRMRVAKTRLSTTKPRRIEGYEVANGVARRLDDAQQAELARLQKLHKENRNLQAKLNQEDAALGAAQDVAAGSQTYLRTLSSPTGAGLIAGADRPRLLGETNQPTWMPVGEAGGVRPVAAAGVRMLGEGMAPESKISIERQRTSTFMAQTPAQFAKRMEEILRQVSRNQVVNRIITNELITSDVKTILGDTTMERIRIGAEQKLQDQGIDLNSTDYQTKLKKQIGDDTITELERQGYEPVSPSKIPDDDIYAGRAPVGNLLDKVDGDQIDPNTLVMRQGMRETLSSYFGPDGGSNVPESVQKVIRLVQRNTARWKSYTLPFSLLRWQTGDALGNVINAHIRAGMDMPDLALRIVEVYERLNGPTDAGLRGTLFGDVFGRNIADPVIQVLMGGGLQNTSLRLSDLNEMHPSGSLRPAPVNAQMGGLFRRFRQGAFAFNETQNGIVRSAVALDKLYKALSDRGRTIDEIDPVSVHRDPVLYEAMREAVEIANEALGNFSELSPFERQTMRTVYPFWTWLKFINRAAAQLLIDQPDRVLFYAHLGSMAMSEDGEDLYGWLKKLTPVPIPGVGTTLIDLSFTNPYSDALLMNIGDLEDLFGETANITTNINPVLRAGLRTAGEAVYGATGRRFPLLEVVPRPGYLEGDPGSTTRGFGDVVGGIAYQNFRTFAGPARFLTDVAPTVRVPGTDVLLGPGPRYQQGSPRTTGVYSRPLLSPTQERITAILSGFGIPSPQANLDQVQEQARLRKRNELRMLRRRQQERRLSRIGR